jgi:hypothetical protein
VDEDEPDTQQGSSAKPEGRNSAFKKEGVAKKKTPAFRDK